MPDRTVLAKLDEIKQVLEQGLTSDARGVNFSQRAIHGSEPRTIQPDTTTEIQAGETATVVSLEVPDNQVFLLSQIGTNDIPHATYNILTDGSSWHQTPSPVGTVAHPFNCLEELGGYIIVRDELAYIVTRDTDAGSPEHWSGIITGRLIQQGGR